MENKYYTPAIEDIRVGYECEIYAVNQELNQKGWIKHTCDSQTAFHWFFKTDNILIRTPYLTKEQIEAEGWLIKARNYGNDAKFSFEKGNYNGIKLLNGKIIIIMKDVLLDDITEKYSNGQLYYGSCPSINEFRTICKLLGIENAKANTTQEKSESTKENSFKKDPTVIKTGEGTEEGKWRF